MALRVKWDLERWTSPWMHCGTESVSPRQTRLSSWGGRTRVTIWPSDDRWNTSLFVFLDLVTPSSLFPSPSVSTFFYLGRRLYGKDCTSLSFSLLVCVCMRKRENVYEREREEESRVCLCVHACAWVYLCVCRSGLCCYVQHIHCPQFEYKTKFTVFSIHCFHFQGLDYLQVWHQ